MYGLLTGRLQALEGQDIKELLVNVGSGGGGGGAPAAAAGGETAVAAEEEKKEERTFSPTPNITARPGSSKVSVLTCLCSSNSRGGVRRGHGLRSLRLSNPFSNLDTDPPVFFVTSGNAWLWGSSHVKPGGHEQHQNGNWRRRGRESILLAWPRRTYPAQGFAALV